METVPVTVLAVGSSPLIASYGLERPDAPLGAPPARFAGEELPHLDSTGRREVVRKEGATVRAISQEAMVMQPDEWSLTVLAPSVGCSTARNRLAQTVVRAVSDSMPQCKAGPCLAVTNHDPLLLEHANGTFERQVTLVQLTVRNMVVD
ncbi:MAG TPA: hypothetical protein VGD81_08200 [Opitutaceae bacterium]